MRPKRFGRHYRRVVKRCSSPRSGERLNSRGGCGGSAVGVMVGDGVTLGDGVRLGDGVAVGDGVALGAVVGTSRVICGTGVTVGLASAHPTTPTMVATKRPTRKAITMYLFMSASFLSPTVLLAYAAPAPL